MEAHVKAPVNRLVPDETIQESAVGDDIAENPDVSSDDDMNIDYQCVRCGFATRR